MPEIIQLGSRHFAHTMEYPTRKFPVVDHGNTQEIEWPYRTGESLVFRIPFTRSAVVVGKWTGAREEEQALSEAIGVRELGAYVPQKHRGSRDTRQDSSTGQEIAE